MNKFSEVTKKKKYVILWTSVSSKESKPLFLLSSTTPLYPHSLWLHRRWESRKSRASTLRRPWRPMAQDSRKTDVSNTLQVWFWYRALGWLTTSDFQSLPSRKTENAQQTDCVGGLLGYSQSHCLWAILVPSLLTLQTAWAFFEVINYGLPPTVLFMILEL